MNQLLLRKRAGARRILRRSLAALLGLVWLAPAGAQPMLRVAAAADLEPVLPPLLAQFQQQTGIRAEATYKSSAMLTTQILNGAPFDLFLAADLGFPQRLIAAGDATGLDHSTTPVTYARGTLVLWERMDSGLPPPSLALLRDPHLKRLAIASPERAPYGRAAVAALKSLNLYADLEPRLATAENISQAAQFAESANAQAGLISLTAALTPQLASSGAYFVIPRDLYPPIEQGAVIMAKAQNAAAACQLLHFLLSPPVQAEFAQRGLTPVH